MIKQNKQILFSLFILGFFFLNSCSLPFEQNEEKETIDTEKKTATDNALFEKHIKRPTALMGIIITKYLSDYNYLNAVTAVKGIDVLSLISKGEKNSQNEETFIVLEEMGSVLQVDVIDLLNRSDNRAQTLDKYIDSLQSILTIGNRKISELTEQKKEFEDSEKEQKGIVRTLEKEVKEAMKKEQYSQVSLKQEMLLKEKTKLNEIEAKLDRTEEILKSFKTVISKMQERLNLLQENREILIAGLQVKDMPGAEKLGILQKNK